MGGYSLLSLVAKAILVVTIDHHSPIEVDLGDGLPVPLVEVVKQVEGMAHHDAKTFFEPVAVTLQRFMLISFHCRSSPGERKTCTLAVRHRPSTSHPQSLHARGCFSSGQLYTTDRTEELL